jgi:alginate O-acetyltransferase complex protein AlgI
VVGWLGIAVILITFHLGLSDVVTGSLRWSGYPVRRLFADPLTSRSLGEFWTTRWNVAFVEMNQVVVVPFLRRFLGRYARAGAFVVSGLLHELAISLPVRAGFGLPTLYFAIHALATGLEPRLRVRRWPSLPARVWTWSLVLAPLPLLFHGPFRDALVLPLFGGSP